jgi:hypothetical protein
MFMINVDRELRNRQGEEPTNCRSPRHAELGSHFDLTVHSLGCYHRRDGSAQSEKRRWDDNNGRGYTFADVARRSEEIGAIMPDTYLRRSRTCGVPPNPPAWD